MPRFGHLTGHGNFSVEIVIDGTGQREMTRASKNDQQTYEVFPGTPPSRVHWKEPATACESID